MEHYICTTCGTQFAESADPPAACPVCEDEPTALGVTLVFHPLAGIDPTSADDEDDEPWTFDFDDELTRDEKGSIVDQTADILRQLSKLSEQALGEYLQAAREDQS